MADPPSPLAYQRSLWMPPSGLLPVLPLLPCYVLRDTPRDIQSFPMELKIIFNYKFIVTCFHFLLVKYIKFAFGPRIKCPKNIFW